MVFVLSISAYMITAQCNITNQTLSLENIDTECSGNKINGSIKNTIIITGSCGKLKFTPPLVDVYHKTSAQTLEKQIKLLISPNPFVQGISINLKSSNEYYDIVVVNLFGQTVFKKSNLMPNKDIRLDLSTIAPGSYFVLIKKDNKLLITKKLIKLNS